MFYIDIKRLRDDVILPSRGSKEAAGFDLYAWSYEKFDYLLDKKGADVFNLGRPDITMWTDTDSVYYSAVQYL